VRVTLRIDILIREQLWSDGQSEDGQRRLASRRTLGMLADVVTSETAFHE
jgi:hypothetical protein